MTRKKRIPITVSVEYVDTGYWTPERIQEWADKYVQALFDARRIKLVSLGSFAQFTEEEDFDRKIEEHPEPLEQMAEEALRELPTEEEFLRRMGSKPGFWESLAPEQREHFLNYDGPEVSGGITLASPKPLGEGVDLASTPLDPGETEVVLDGDT